MDKIAIIIPCYNEGITIKKVVTDFKMSLPEAVIYVYDNNSTDNTVSEASAAGAIVKQERLQGKGNVVRRALREIDAACYLMVDGDDTYPAQSAPELCNAVLNEGYEMCIGDRLGSNYFTINKRKGHNSGNSLIRNSINFLFNSKVTDILTGYRAMSFLFAKSLPILSGGFEIETELTVHGLDKRLNYTSIPIQYQNRPAGSFSKLHTIKDGSKVLITLFNLFKNYRPLLFFSFVSFILIVAAGLLVYPVFTEYLRTGLVPRFPTLILSFILILIAVNAFLIGLNLDSLVNKERREFEFRLHQLHGIQTRLNEN